MTISPLSPVIAYLAFSLPVVAAGFATTSVSLRPTTAVYSLGVVALAVIALAVIALVAQRVRAALSLDKSIAS